jgi:hypothetical protein
MSAAMRISPSTWNRYAYSVGDPVNRNDPRGLCSQDKDGNYYDDDDEYNFLYSGPCSFDEENGGLSSPGAGGSVTVFASVSADGAIAAGDDSAVLAWAQGVIAGVNANNPGGFLNALMVSAVGAGATGGAVSVLAGFGIGTAAASAAIMGQQGFVDAVTGLYYSGYVQIAGVVGASTFGVSEAEWEELGQTSGAQLAALQGYISSAASKGADLIFAQDPSMAPVTSWTYQEYQYVLSQGWSVVQQGSSWIVKY